MLQRRACTMAMERGEGRGCREAGEGATTGARRNKGGGGGRGGGRVQGLVLSMRTCRRRG